MPKWLCNHALSSLSFVISIVIENVVIIRELSFDHNFISYVFPHILAKNCQQVIIISTLWKLFVRQLHVLRQIHYNISKRKQFHFVRHFSRHFLK